MRGKLGRYLDLDEHLALGVTIAWYPGFSHAVTWAALWDFMTDFQARGTKAWDDFVAGRRERPYPRPEVPADGEGDTRQEADESFYVLLSNASSNALIDNAYGWGTIVNDDGKKGKG